MNEKYIGDGKVYLLSDGKKVYTDIAARFVKSERPVVEIIESPYNANIVKNILESGHLAATEFDFLIFGVEGYSRVCEVQLVRKRIASYLIKSGRQELGGKRMFTMVAPKEIYNATVNVDLDTTFTDTDGDGDYKAIVQHKLTLSGRQIMDIINQWYDYNLSKGMKEEDLRYLKPQATEFKGIIGMNVRALMDFFKVRTCFRAQTEIRDMANKMLKLSKEAYPDLFKDAGPNCKVLGYCPENQYQCEEMKDKIPTKEKMLDTYKKYGKHSDISNVSSNMFNFFNILPLKHKLQDTISYKVK